MENKNISVIIDNDSSMEYEKRKWWYFLTVPIIFIFTVWVAIKKKIFGPNLKVNIFWFDGICSVCREIKENATNWRALDNMYNYKFKKDPTLKGKITDFWAQGILNSVAMRNRLKLVKKLFKKSIKELSLENKEIRVISVASGSAQGIIEVMKEFKETGIVIKAIFLDIDLSALEHSKKLAQKAGVINKIIFMNRSVRDLEEVARDFKPHIVEIVGFLEYRPNQKAIKLIKRAHNLLPLNGILLTSTVSTSLESVFIHYVVNWPMIYRNLKKFIKILIGGGFQPGNIQIFYEPLKIQKIAICRKFI